MYFYYLLLIQALFFKSELNKIALYNKIEHEFKEIFKRARFFGADKN